MAEIIDLVTKIGADREPDFDTLRGLAIAFFADRIDDFLALDADQVIALATRAGIPESRIPGAYKALCSLVPARRKN